MKKRRHQILFVAVSLRIDSRTWPGPLDKPVRPGAIPIAHPLPGTMSGTRGTKRFPRVIPLAPTRKTIDTPIRLTCRTDRLEPLRSLGTQVSLKCGETPQQPSWRKKGKALRNAISWYPWIGLLFLSATARNPLCNRCRRIRAKQKPATPRLWNTCIVFPKSWVEYRALCTAC